MVVHVGDEALKVPTIFEGDRPGREWLLVTDDYASSKLQVLRASFASETLHTDFGKQLICTRKLSPKLD
ncbi:hypothetical protein MKFW12EY_27940 [Methylomonas koyamae]|nr:hypothetical protein MKFW12EY_27940 [Methylomonas koyamae]